MTSRGEAKQFDLSKKVVVQVGQVQEDPSKLNRPKVEKEAAEQKMM